MYVPQAIFRPQLSFSVHQMVTHYIHVSDATRDVNKTREPCSFFSIPGKEFLDFRESRLPTARQYTYCEWDNCQQ